jgi:hypothetical protein
MVGRTEHCGKCQDAQKAENFLNNWATVNPSEKDSSGTVNV